MTRIDFYFNARSKAEVLGKLVAKATGAGSAVLIYTRDPGRGREIDQYLWSSPLLSFIPHVSCKHPLARKTPVLIGDDPGCLSRFDVLINLDVDVPDCFSRFDRMLEIVSVDAGDKEDSRKRYQYFKERGYPLVMHDLQKPT